MFKPCEVRTKRRGQIVFNPKTVIYHIYIRDEQWCEAARMDEEHDCTEYHTRSLDRQYSRRTEPEARQLLAEKLAQPPNLSASNE